MSIRHQFTSFVHRLQDEICQALEEVDGDAKFISDQWQREGGGGGDTRVIAGGRIFEKGGVNTSVVHGKLPDSMKKKFGVSSDDFYATGISLVLHPGNPYVPTVHANFRYFEILENGQVIDQWFGGGADLTPYYIFEEDARHFHQTWKSVCDTFNPEFYPTFKKNCDDYFFNSHRNEARGIGGIFFDYLKQDDEVDILDRMNFTMAAGEEFLNSYLPILTRRRDLSFDQDNKYWQEIRRGRYVEFNLIHDRGTTFGLKTNGRTESILMSLPPTVRWDYDFQPESGSEEAKLLESLKPRNWLAI